MSTALQEIKEKSNPEDVQIDLSEIQIIEFSNEIKEYLQSCKSLEVLIISNCGLTTLQNFPHLKLLQAIDISNNELSDSSNLKLLTQSKNLTQIFLGQNNISKIETLLSLKTLQKLIEIDCEGNPVAKENKYRETIFKEFSTIQIVDRVDKDGNAVEDEEEFQDDEDDDEFDEEEFDQDDDEEDYEEEEESDPKPSKKTKKK